MLALRTVHNLAVVSIGPSLQNGLSAEVAKLLLFIQYIEVQIYTVKLHLRTARKQTLLRALSGNENKALEADHFSRSACG
jgi:hypothetical protein